jgi:hypothetical protein
MTLPRLQTFPLRPHVSRPDNSLLGRLILVLAAPKTHLLSLKWIKLVTVTTANIRFNNKASHSLLPPPARLSRLQAIGPGVMTTEIRGPKVGITVTR